MQWRNALFVNKIFPPIFSFFLILFYHFCIYLHVYALFGPPPAMPLGRTCSALLFSDIVEKKVYKKR
jgi:hypothetical protein